MGGSQISLPPRAFNASDVKVRRTGMTVLGKIDESGPLSQPLPEASHDEAPSSGSLNVSMKSKGRNVDVSLCDESSSFSGPTKSRSDLISSILNDIAEVEGKDIAKVEDVDLDDLMKDMSELLKLREKHILKDIRGPFKGLPKDTGGAPSVAPIDLFSERCDAVFTNREKCWHLIKEMYYLAGFHKKLRENPEGMQDVMQEATALILEGARLCCPLIGRSAFTSFFSTSPLEIKGALKDFTERLNLMPIRITLQMGFRLLSDIERQGRSHLSKGYPTPAESGPFSQPLPGACHDEAPFSGSFNVSMKSKGKNVDVSFNVSGTTRCDEASSSGYSDLPKRSEGQDFNVNLNISGAPRYDEAPSSSSSSGPTKSRSDEIKYKVEDVNLDDLWKHIFELRKLREKGNHQEASILGYFPWPDVPDLQKLKEIVSFGTDLRKEDIHGPVKALLKEIVNVATAAPLVVAHTLERFDIFTNREKCWHLIREMYYLAIVHKRLRENAEGMQDVMQEATSFEGMQDVMQEATSLIIEGALVCFTQTGRSAFTRFFSTSPLEFEGALSNFRQKLNTMYMKINTEIALRGFTLIEHQGRSPLSKEYPTRAESDPFSQPLSEASHDEAPVSGSLNVSMKSKGKNVDVSLCDEASSDLPKTSEDVDINLNISGAPRCDEAPSSSASSSSGPTKSKSDLISSIRKDIDKVEDFNLDDLMKHMSELLKLREKDRQSFGIVPRKSKDMRNWQDRQSFGIVPRKSKDMLETLKALLRAVGNASLVSSSTLLVAETVEIFDTAFTNTEKCWHLIKEMYDLAIVLKRLRESAEGMQDVMQDATSLIIECALVCCTQIGGSASTRFFTAVLMEKALEDIMERLNVMHIKISIQIRFRVLTAIQLQERSHLSKGYATHAGTPRCDEASSSGYSDLPKRSEGQDVDVDLNISGARRFDEAPSSFSSSGPTKSRSDLISSKRKDKVEDVNLDDLWKHIFELRKLREKGNHQEASSLDHFPRPDFPGLQKSKEIGRVNVATAARLVVAHTSVFDAIFTNREKCWHLRKEMYDLAIVIKRLRESAEGMQDVMQEATSLIIEGKLVCFPQTGRFAFTRFFSKSPLVFEGALSNIRQKLNAMYIKINTEIALRGFTLIEHQGRSPLSKEYPTRADNGQVEEDLLSTGRQKVFKIEALVGATNNFHKDNEVGEGGFGAVYKGTTDDGKQIAVKKMSFPDERSREFRKKQFKNEKLLAEVQHRNLVNLLGSCEQESQGFLVYEYLPNKSLDKFLFDPENRKLLDWYKRYNIIEGIVCGLCYLHEYSQRRIVHRDIKTSNILLDEKLNPKIADFGTAKLFPEDTTHVIATEPVGTRGYMAPEYAIEGQITVKVDVYSFGVVLLELLTGKSILNNLAEYLEWVWSSYNQNKVADTIDRTITETWDKEMGKAKAKALRCFQVALLCIQNEAKLRPTMSQVKMMLSSAQSLLVPTKPPLVSSPRRSCFDSMLQRGGGK